MRPIQRHAFTITELLVAIGVVVVMMIIVGQIFLRTTNAVSQALATSEGVAGFRTVSDQIKRDFETMIGPDEVPDATGGGILVIVNQMIGYSHVIRDGDTAWGVRLTKPLGPDAPDEERESLQSIIRPIRSDQITFIRQRAPGEGPITPGDDDTFEPWYEEGSFSPYVRIWYGHVKRTNSDGSESPHRLGDPNYATEDADGINWLFGRHALFLGIDTADLTDNGNFADENATLDSNTTLAGYPLYMGTTDYADVSYDDPEHPNGSIVGADETTGHFGEYRLHGEMDPDTTTTDYHERAIELYTFVEKRLHANPLPMAYESHNIAQMHPILMQHVSDFIVEFAADIYTDDEYDPTPFDPDEKIDVDANGNIRWYGYWFNNEDDGRRVLDNNGNPDVVPYDSDLNLPVVYKVPNDWPPFIEGYVTANGEFVDAFVFRHDDDAPGAGSNWPYLLRIRYRMHDRQGKLMSGAGHHGMWFEQIIRVPRP